MPRTVAVAVLIAGLVLPGPATAQTAAPSSTSAAPVRLFSVAALEPSITGPSSATGLVPEATTSPPGADRRGEILIAPLPMINPTLDNGLALVGGYLYRLDRTDQVTPPSLTVVGGFATSNDSWGGAFLQKLHLRRDRVRILGVAAYADVNYDYYGIGQDAGNAGRSIELNQKGPVAVVDTLVRVAPQWYAGGRYQILDMRVFTPGLSVDGGPTIPAADATLRTAALGPRAQFDSRDNPFYPRRGIHFDVVASFYGEAVGGRRKYQSYQAFVSHFVSAGERDVIAWHTVVCGVYGSVPFYDICALGKSSDLRGYQLGQYRDDRMIAAQAEWRREIWWRFGGVLFAGVGEVSPEFSRVSWNDLLPSGGVGVRLTLAKQNHVNLRVDYAWGKKSSALYVSVAEAF